MPICQCQSECKSKRCACLKEGKACTDRCCCLKCKNPFNTIKNAEQLTDCSRAHIKKVIALSEKELNKKYELLCGCEEAKLEELLEDYECSKCSESCYYSFCMGEVIYTNCMWHCHACGTCREDSEWHCKHCNQCTYGITLSCESCGRKSPYMP
jgi:hypothetical protein